MSLVTQTFEVCKKVKNSRSGEGILTHTVTELGELATEVLIKEGKSYKQEGKDGVVGEAIDTIVCLLDIIHHYYPEITEEELQKIAAVKLQKWEDSERRV